jgi:hypothetical protein
MTTLPAPASEEKAISLRLSLRHVLKSASRVTNNLKKLAPPPLLVWCQFLAVHGHDVRMRIISVPGNRWCSRTVEGLTAGKY